MSSKKTTKRKRNPQPRRVNHVLIVLDKSGSMSTIQQEAVDALNNQIDAIRKSTKGKRISVKVTVATFDTLPNPPLYFAVPLSQIKKFTLGDYQPNGWTAMLDSVGDNLTQLRAHLDFERPSTTALVLVISDGEENYSRRHNWSTVAEQVNSLQNTGRWTFTYAGANQDLSQIVNRLSIPLLNVQQFQADPAGYKYAQYSRSLGTQAYYATMDSAPIGAAVSVNNFYDDKNTTDKKDSDK